MHVLVIIVMIDNMHGEKLKKKFLVPIDQEAWWAPELQGYSHNFCSIFVSPNQQQLIKGACRLYRLLTDRGCLVLEIMLFCHTHLNIYVFAYPLPDNVSRSSAQQCGVHC